MVIDWVVYWSEKSMIKLKKNRAILVHAIFLMKLLIASSWDTKVSVSILRKDSYFYHQLLPDTEESYNYSM